MRCPICSREVVTEWKNTNLKECECHTILQLSPFGKWEIATASVTKIPSRFLQVGSTGVFDKRSFVITGRVFAQGEEAAQNFWSICFHNGDRAILSEGYGHFAVMQKTTAPFEVDTLRFKSMKIGDNAISKTKKHKLVRRDEFVKFTVEGDNEWGEVSGIVQTFDFFVYDGQYTEVLKFSDGKTFVFDCTFFLPGELVFENTRENHDIKTYTCENCNASNTIYAHPYTFSSNCVKCNLRYEYDVNKDQYLKTRKKDTGYIPDIEIGSTGILDGIEFKVIGYARKKETASTAEWNEYTLYHPKMGFAYLSEFEGHWVYVKEWPKPPMITSQGKDYFVENENEFELFNDYHYGVEGAVGEHIYDLNKTSDYRVAEYIFPPQILTQEKSKHEENWFYGDHIEAKKVKKTFSFPNGLPKQIGVGAVEPMAFLNKSTLILIAFFGIVLVLATHLIFSITKQERVIFSDTVFFEQQPNTITGVTPQFKLDKKESNLEVKMAANVTNSWVEFAGSFVNVATGKEYNFNKGVEYYEGYDDGKWSEGSRESKAVLTEIPPGNYYMDYYIVKDSTSFNSNFLNGVAMTVRYDVPLTRNFLWAAFFILAVAVIQYCYYYYNDKRRWENSKYTPYSYE